MIEFNFYKVFHGSAVYLAYNRIFRIFNSKVKCSKIENNRVKSDFVVCSDLYQVILVFIMNLGKPNIIFWVQGSAPHESFLKHQSFIKFFILWVLEYLALIISSAHIYVSPYMKEFYQKKPLINKKNMVLPCFSDLKQNPKIERNPNNYCYIGGMSKWQNFDKIINIMNLIVEKKSKAKFSIATNDLLLCEQKIKNLGSDNLKKVTSIVSLSSKQEIEDFLSEASYGFLIRDDIIVNNVASPIKLAEYFSCGVNVISTKGITSYIDLISEAGFIIDEQQIDLVKNINLSSNQEQALKVFRENFSEISVSNNIDKFLADIGLLK